MKEEWSVEKDRLDHSYQLFKFQPTSSPLLRMFSTEYNINRRARRD